MTKSMWSVTSRYLFLLFLLSVCPCMLHGMDEQITMSKEEGQIRVTRQIAEAQRASRRIQTWGDNGQEAIFCPEPKRSLLGDSDDFAVLVSEPTTRYHNLSAANQKLVDSIVENGSSAEGKKKRTVAREQREICAIGCDLQFKSFMKHELPLRDFLQRVYAIKDYDSFEKTCSSFISISKCVLVAMLKGITNTSSDGLENYRYVSKNLSEEQVKAAARYSCINFDDILQAIEKFKQQTAEGEGGVGRAYGKKKTQRKNVEPSESIEEQRANANVACEQLLSSESTSAGGKKKKSKRKKGGRGGSKPGCNQQKKKQKKETRRQRKTRELAEMTDEQIGQNDYSGDLSLSEFTDKYDGLSSEDRQRFNRNLVTALENGSLGEPSVFAAGVAESQRPVKYDDFLSLSELPACNFLKRVYDMNFQDVRLFFKTFPNESAQLHKCLSGIFLESPENIASADVEQYRNFCKHSLTLKKVKKFARSCNVDFEDVEQAIKQFKQQAAESASFPFTMRPDDTGNGGEVVLTQDQLQNVPQWMFNNVDGGEPFALLAGVEESQRPVRYEEDLLSLQQQARPGVEVSRGGNIVNYIVDFSPKLQPQMDDRYKTACKKFDSPSSIIDHVLSRLFSIDRAGVACFQEKYSRHYGVIGNSILSYRKTRFYSYFIEQSFDPKSLSGYTKYFDDLVKSAGVSVTNFLFKGYSEKGLKKLCNAVKRSNKQGQTAGQRKNSENRGSIKEQRASSDVALAELLSLKSTDVQKKKKSGGKKGRGGKKRGRNKKKKKKKAQSKKKRTTTPALPTEPAVHIPHDTPNSPSDSDENSTMLQVVAQTDQDNASGMPVQDEGVSKEQVGLECAEAVAAFGGWEKIVCCFLKHVCPLLSTEQRGVLCQTSERTDEVLGQQAVFRQGTVQRFVKALFSERYLFYKERHGSDVGSCLINALVVKDCGNYEYNRNFYGTHFDQSIKRVLENGILDQEIGNEDNNLVLLKAREKEIGLDITYPFFAELYQLTGLDYERIKHDQKFYLSLQHCVAGIFANHFYKNANQYNKKHGPEKWKTELTLDIMRSAGFLGNDLLAHINEDDMREEVGRLRALHMPEETQ